jgi:hypothetical protein
MMCAADGSNHLWRCIKRAGGGPPPQKEFPLSMVRMLSSSLLLAAPLPLLLLVVLPHQTSEGIGKEAIFSQTHRICIVFRCWKINGNWKYCLAGKLNPLLTYQGLILPCLV